MEKVLYTKFNSTRKPEFRLRTSVILSDGTRRVVKSPMEECAIHGISMLKENYARLRDFYGNIVPVSYKENGDSLEFPFVEGRGILDDVDFHGDSYEQILTGIRSAVDLLFDFSDRCTKPFEMSDAFAQMFAGCEVADNERSFRVTNLDSIFDNFIICQEQIYCIDYEWVFDFDIPARYVLYRALHYLYQDKIEFLERFEDENSFLSRFGLDEVAETLYSFMEQSFQQYVHGKDWRYIYINNYRKPANRLSMSEVATVRLNQQISDLTDEVMHLREVVELTNNHADNLTAVNKDLQEQIEYKDKVIADYVAYKEKMDKALHNPLYAASLAAKKLGSKAEK